MKIQLQHPALREFFEQLRFAPMRQRHKHLAAVEKLMLIIDPEMEYPYEFIVYRITGFRPSTAKYEDCLIKGDKLLSDLRLWLTQISGRLDVPAASQPEPVFSVEELAARFSVSEKTIRRWQARGLAGRIYLFDDGKKRKGFCASAVEKFETQNRRLLARSAAFTKLDTAEKERLYELACEMAQTGRHRTRNELLVRVSESTGRARETVRYVLEEMERQHGPCQAAPASRGRLGAKEAAHIYKLSRQGVPTRELIEQFKKSRSTLHRIINQHRAKDLMARKIEFIHSPEFEAPNADARLLATATGSLIGDSQAAPVMLTRQQESDLFCRYNFLKYLAVRLRDGIRLQQPAVRLLNRIETLLDEADRVKQYIVQSNMPLVVSIAGRHQGAQMAMNELVSEGMLALMAAVEKFDYTRANRFSTYAGWAIVRDFARKIPAESRRPDRAGGGDIDSVPYDFRMGDVPGVAALEQTRHDLIGVIGSNLDDRERFIILNRYPLDAAVIKQKPMTLKQLGDALGLTKERVRQIELQALHKLRQSLSPEQFDLLTG